LSFFPGSTQNMRVNEFSTTNPQLSNGAPKEPQIDPSLQEGGSIAIEQQHPQEQQPNVDNLLDVPPRSRLRI